MDVVNGENTVEEANNFFEKVNNLGNDISYRGGIAKFFS